MELFGGVGACYYCSWFQRESCKNGGAVLAVLWLGVLELAVSEEANLSGGNQGVCLDLSCDALEKGFLVLLKRVSGVLGGDWDPCNCEGTCWCVD